MNINLKFDNIIRNLQETSEKIFTFGKGNDTVSNVISLIFGTGNASIISNNGVIQWKDQGGTAKNISDISSSTTGTNESSYIINKDNATADAESSQIEFEVGTGTNAVLKYDHTDHTIGINKSFKIDDIVLAVDGDDDITIDGDKIMTAKNDGTGSGFDADKVDGMDADEFAPAGHVGDDGDAHAEATQLVNGFMPNEDKTKLDKFFIYNDVSTVANAIEIVPSPAVTEYVAGFTAFIKIANSVTGAVTIKFNDLAVKDLKKFYYTTLETGDLYTNQIILIQYDGTQFQLLSDIKLPGTPIYKNKRVVIENTTLVPGTKYIIDGLTTIELTLPETAIIGDLPIEIVGKAGGWKVVQRANQQIFINASNSTLGATGYIESTAVGDCIRLECITADTVWRATSYTGTITLA